MKTRLFGGIVALGVSLCAASQGLALTAGQAYTVTVKKITSAGAVDGTAAATTTANADSDGRLAFSLSSVPDSSACNFMQVTVNLVTDGSLAREAIVPCPPAGATLPFGVSGVTDKQASALQNAFQTAGTDDPILAVFGMAIIRTTGIGDGELATIGSIAKSGINDAGGFIDHLTTTRGVTAGQISAYRSSIISQLADSSTGYCKLIKDSVDVAGVSDDPSKRGEAASQLLGVLVRAATDAGFPQDYVMEAFNSMGSVVMPLFQAQVGLGNLTATTLQAINSSIGGGIQKLRANRGTEKYSAALTTLGATGADVTQFQTAANTLATTMRTAFSTFEAAAFANGTENAAAISAAETILQATMNTAFSTFMDGVASTNGRLTTMIGNIESALGLAPGASGLAVANFQFYKNGGGAANWPVSMVVLTDWVSSIVGATGGMTYARDTVAIPADIIWMGECADLIPGDKAACLGRGQAWTPKRTCFGAAPAANEANVALCRNIPASYANLFAIQEDIMIREFTRFAAMQGAGGDMGAQETAERNFTDGLRTAVAGNLGGTTNGVTPISAIQKQAVVTLMQSPQF